MPQGGSACHQCSTASLLWVGVTLLGSDHRCTCIAGQEDFRGREAVSSALVLSAALPASGPGEDSPQPTLCFFSLPRCCREASKVNAGNPTLCPWDEVGGIQLGGPDGQRSGQGRGPAEEPLRCFPCRQRRRSEDTIASMTPGSQVHVHISLPTPVLTAQSMNQCTEQLFGVIIVP